MVRLSTTGGSSWLVSSMWVLVVALARAVKLVLTTGGWASWGAYGAGDAWGEAGVVASNLIALEGQRSSLASPGAGISSSQSAIIPVSSDSLPESVGSHSCVSSGSSSSSILTSLGRGRAGDPSQ